MRYGYCRTSKPKQSIERQIRNIKAAFPDAVIVQEVFTRTRLDRPEWLKLMRRIQPGDKIIFETVVLLGRELEKSREHVYLDYEPSAEIDLPGGATYSEIKQWIQAEYDLKVSSLYVAQVKQKHGIVERECYNKPKSENAKQPKCPPEKEAAIEAALKHFKMI